MAPLPPNLPNLDEPFDDLPLLSPTLALNPNYANQRAFDTWFRAPVLDAMNWNGPLTGSNGNPGFLAQSPAQVPVRINVRALQIRLRIWDPRKEQARQVTIIQEI